MENIKVYYGELNFSNGVLDYCLTGQRRKGNDNLIGYIDGDKNQKYFTDIKPITNEVNDLEKVICDSIHNSVNELKKYETVKSVTIRNRSYDNDKLIGGTFSVEVSI